MNSVFEDYKKRRRAHFRQACSSKVLFFFLLIHEASPLGQHKYKTFCIFKWKFWHQMFSQTRLRSGSLRKKRHTFYTKVWEEQQITLIIELIMPGFLGFVYSFYTCLTTLYWNSPSMFPVTFFASVISPINLTYQLIIISTQSLS